MIGLRGHPYASFHHLGDGDHSGGGGAMTNPRILFFPNSQEISIIKEAVSLSAFGSLKDVNPSFTNVVIVTQVLAIISVNPS